MAWTHKGSRQSRGYGPAWDKTRAIILKRDGYLCQGCKAKGRATPLKVKPYDHAVDHIVPKAQGGTDDHANLQSLCTDCHTIKSTGEATIGRGARVTDRLQYDASGNPIWE